MERLSPYRRLFYRLAFFSAVLFVMTLLFGPIVCDVAFFAGKKLQTRTMFHNLKTAMSHYMTSGFPDETDFPGNASELAAMLREDMGLPDLGDGRSLDEPVRDGWGRELKVEGNSAEYIIRSAGRDGRYKTEDDIYLKGGPSGENIYGDIRRKNLSLGRIKRRFNRLPFQDPTGYYHVLLPGSYRVIDESDGYESNILFLYSEGDELRMIADPVRDTMEMEMALRERATAIQRGDVPDYDEFEMVRSGLVDVQGGNGYEIRLESPDTVIHEFLFRGGYAMSVRIRILSKSKERREIVDFLEEEIENHLTIH